jgi:tetratricopeptide (TPR) repeat protein
VADQFGEAERLLSNARYLFEQGTGDPLLEVRLLEFEASLLATLRRFNLATQKLHAMLAFYERHGDSHLVGYTLVKLGLYAGYEGNFDLATRRLEQSLGMIDTERDPALAYAASHNLILFLVDSGRIAEAKKLRLVHSRHLLSTGGRINQIKFRDLEGRIAFGEGNYQRAESIFLEVRQDLAELGLPVLAGIAMLDLSAPLLAQGKAQEAERTVIEAKKLFVALGIHREALQAVILLRDSFRMQNATLAKVVEVANFLRSAVSVPSLRFEARAWEG